MKYLLSWVLFCCFLTTSWGQLSALKNNPDIVWLAESFAVCTLDEDSKYLATNYVDCKNTLIKYVYKYGLEDFSKSATTNFSLKQFVIGLLENKKAKLYRSHDLKKTISTQKIVESRLRDTVITFDPDTFEEIVQVFTYKVKYSFFEGIKVYQDWAWDNTKGQLIIQQKAFSPIYTESLLNGKLEKQERPHPYLIKLSE